MSSNPPFVFREASQVALALITRWEGLHRVGKDGLVYPYICPAGYPTQGYGIVVSSIDVPPITKDEAELLLLRAVPAYMKQALVLCPPLVAHQRKLGAVTSWTFNLGVARLKASTMRKRILEGDWEAAARECRRWRFAGPNVLPGLVARRAAESAIIEEAL